MYICSKRHSLALSLVLPLPRALALLLLLLCPRAPRLPAFLPAQKHHHCTTRKRERSKGTRSPCLYVAVEHAHKCTRGLVYVVSVDVCAGVLIDPYVSKSTD